MADVDFQVDSLAELCDFVQHTICEHQQLVAGAFPFHEKLLVRGGQPCGMHFTMSGPRSVHFSAIWDADRRTALFYDCNGDRFHRACLQYPATVVDELRALQGKSVRVSA